VSDIDNKIDEPPHAGMVKVDVDGVMRWQNWTECQNIVDRMTELWSRGISMMRIAETLSSDFNTEITKNMVLGKVHRMRLSENNEREAQIRQVAPKLKVKASTSAATWTPEIDAALLRYSAQGDTPTQIGYRLRTKYAISTSPQAITKRLSKLRTDRDGERAVPVIHNDVMPESGGVAFEDHKFYSCHWPMYASGETPRFCGGTLWHRSYCKDHAKRAFQSLPVKPMPIGTAVATA